jgi:hypothetical protein
MNYQKIYDNLVHKRQNEPATGYVERHHIVMRSMGGSDEHYNIVKLTGREHWIAHALLFKIHRNSKAAHACHMMAMNCEERENPYIRNSRMYEAARLACVSHLRAYAKLRVGPTNGSYGTHWISNLEEKVSKRQPKHLHIPKGWVKGRSVWKIEEDAMIKRSKAKSKRDLKIYEKGEARRAIQQRMSDRQAEIKNEALLTFEAFKNSHCTSIRDFVKQGYYSKTIQNLATLWRKHVPEYKPLPKRSFKF